MKYGPLVSRYSKRRVVPIDSLVIRQGSNIERLCSAGAQGERVGLFLRHERSAVGLIDIQTERGGQPMGDDERQVFKALQLTGLLMADLQAHGVVALFQFQRILQTYERTRAETWSHAKKGALNPPPGEARLTW